MIKTKADTGLDFLTLEPITLIIIDDNEMILRMWKRLFADQLHWTIYTTSEPLEAIEFLKISSADLIISDVVMPTMNGFRLAEFIREIDPEIQIVLTSGYLENFSDIIIEGPPLNFLTKPYHNIEEVGNFIKCLVAKNDYSKNDSERVGDLMVWSL